MRLNICPIPLSKYLYLCLFILLSCNTSAQSFSYAFLTDTHVGSATGEEDLIDAVADINQQKNIDFVLLTGDVTEMGTDKQLRLSKNILSKLNKPYYVIPGNHDTGWSESGGVSFLKEFGNDKFTFDHKGFRFIACASGPYVRMSDGHIPRDAIIWLDSILKKTPVDMPVIFINHYPIDNSLDNWYEVINRLKTHNIQYIICGHGHRNKPYNLEGITGIMGRSNLRTKDGTSGYNIVTMKKDSVFFAEKNPQQVLKSPWKKFQLRQFVNDTTLSYPRPDYSVNTTFNNIQEKWRYHSNANVSVTPAQNRGVVVFGNSLGYIEALSFKTGKKLWEFATQGAIYSSPSISKNSVIIGSGDGNVYALELKSGALLWKYQTEMPILGSPLIEKNRIYIGGSDGKFRCLDLKTGKQLWSFNGLEGAMVSKPLLYKGKVIFGCWDKHLYALDQKTGHLLWKWDNGSPNVLFSPAMCIPVASKNMIFIVAPDRVLTAIDANTGKTLWRNKDATVRESIGIAEDGRTVYAKTMMNDIVAYKTERTDPGILWRLNAGFGYEHVPSMLVERNGKIFFGTRNGVVYAINNKGQKTVWTHKIDNSMINTLNVINSKTILVATVDGVITVLTNKK